LFSSSETNFNKELKSRQKFPVSHEFKAHPITPKNEKYLYLLSFEKNIF